MKHLIPWFVIFLVNTAVAFPEGAPWGAANPDSEQSCPACHFDYDAILNSEYLFIEGIPDKPAAGTTYELVVSLNSVDALTAGFQMLASDGQFASMERYIEYAGSAIRSTKPATNSNGVSWSLVWTAPNQPNTSVIFYLAVTGANDDGSPFGDRIHFRSFETFIE